MVRMRTVLQTTHSEGTSLGTRTVTYSIPQATRPFGVVHTMYAPVEHDHRVITSLRIAVHADITVFSPVNR